MKPFIFSILMISGLHTYAQTVTTTTINGSLKVNDSVNVSNNLEAAEIRSRGELIAKDVMRGESDIIVAGNATVGGNLVVSGTSHLQSGFLAPGMLIGDLTDNIKISMQTLSTGAKILAFGFPGEVTELANKCVQPYNSSSLSIFNSRAGVIHTSSSNMLDFNNDGSNGSIDYGFNINQYAAFDPNNSSAQVRPALKLNGLCWGDVEIAKGGGFVSTGGWFEVGNPARNGSITSNINSQAGRIGQRITSASSYPESTTNPPEQFNTQLFVNRSKIKAITVFNTASNASGDQTFVVYGNGRTHIGTGRPVVGGPVANAMLTVDGLIIAKEVKVTVSAAYWADYVFDKSYKLLPLKDVRAFIEAHGHLPNVPSTEEITTQGNDLGKTDAILLAKIEECMLYIMELDKKVSDLQKENTDLKKKAENHKSN